MTSAAQSVAAIVQAAGPHVPELLARVEERLVDARGRARAGARRARRRDDRRRRQAPAPAARAARRRPRARRPGELVACAAAVELVHSATLVHDDVLDERTLRRGQPTVWAQGGRLLATATGDLLFSRAFAELAATGTLESVRALSRATSALAEGELLQREDAWNAAVAVDRYLYRCELKTARLFEAACRARRARRAPAGGRRRGARRVRPAHRPRLPAARRRPRRRRARRPTTGKHRGTDLLDGTVTLPLILARERDPDARRDRPAQRSRRPQQADELCERIVATGALADGDGARARRSSTRRRRELAGLELEDGQRLALNLVADEVVDRYA